MFAKIVKGKDLAQLEKNLNDFLNDVKLLDNVSEMLPAKDQKKLKIYNVQQFVIGEVDPKTVSLLSQQPMPTYSFCLLLICGYE